MRADGATDGDHSEARRRIESRMGGAARKKVAKATLSDDHPEFPDVLDYLWNWFWEILDGCPPNGMAPVAIGWRDLSAWCELAVERLEPWESRLILQLSALRSTIIAEAHDSQNQN